MTGFVDVKAPGILAKDLVVSLKGTDKTGAFEANFESAHLA